MARKASADLPDPPSVPVPGAAAPVRTVSSEGLKALGTQLNALFQSYRSDRRVAELRWTRNLRQYLGIYDPDVEKMISGTRSKAYPKLTRIKTVSVLARIMDLMFQGSERNWDLKSSPQPDVSVDEAQIALQDAQKADQAAGVQTQVDADYLNTAIRTYVDKRVGQLRDVIDDQLQELGGDQTYDYVRLNREVLKSSILYGLGVMTGPFVRETKKIAWGVENGQATKNTITVYKPQFEFLPIWDFYPDLSAKRLDQMDGYFRRYVMSRSQLRKLANRSDFFRDVITKYLADRSVGNYKLLEFESELRVMGVKINVNEQKQETSKYEVIVWHGPVSGQMLQRVGVDVAQDKLADEMMAEVWMVDGYVIKADLNPWAKIGADVRMVHCVLFDEDDTSPLGQGLPNVMRDSQMSVANASRMLLDNASVVCGPMLEINRKLLPPDQDLSSIEAYKMWYRDLDEDPASAQFPAVREIKVDSHIKELTGIIELFMQFADAETFVGPATGGDMSRAPSEPMRTAAGASMLRGDAALPFKDFVRSFDTMTQSIIESLIQFNRKFNPDLVADVDYNVIARGATSLIAKELRGMQIDQLAQSLTDEEKDYVDHRKFATARFRVRDLEDMLVSDAEADRNRQQRMQSTQQAQALQQEMAKAEMRKVLADAFKAITQGQKNSAAADAQAVDSALRLLEQGLNNDGQTDNNGPAKAPKSGERGSGVGPDAAAAGGLSAGDQGQAGQLPNGAMFPVAGGGAGLPPAAGGFPAS